MELEEMGAFFDARLSVYEAHQLSEIDSAGIFYPFTAAQLPMGRPCRVLDLGCGTGLELDAYFARNPRAEVTGIDLAPGMLRALEKKHPDRGLTLICGSYFDVPFPAQFYDAAVSVESLHHFSQAEKQTLYAKLRGALKPGGYFILTDFFASDDRQEEDNFLRLAQLKGALDPADRRLYHYDTPLTLAHEMDALRAAGFAGVEVLERWGATAAIRACR